MELEVKKQKLEDKIMGYIDCGLRSDVKSANHDMLLGSNLQYHCNDVQFLKNYCVKFATLAPRSNPDDIQQVLEFFSDEQNVQNLIGLVSQKVNSEEVGL